MTGGRRVPLYREGLGNTKGQLSASDRVNLYSDDMGNTTVQKGVQRISRYTDSLVSTDCRGPLLAAIAKGLATSAQRPPQERCTLYFMRFYSGMIGIEQELHQ